MQKDGENVKEWGNSNASGASNSKGDKGKGKAPQSPIVLKGVSNLNARLLNVIVHLRRKISLPRVGSVTGGV